MTLTGPVNSIQRRFAAWLMLLAVLVRVAIPLGWMPNLHGLSSGSLIVICSAQGLHSLELDASGKVQPNGTGEKRGGLVHQDCACAGLGTLSLATSLTLSGVSRAAQKVLYAVVSVRPLANRLQGAGDTRGPPSDLRA